MGGCTRRRCGPTTREGATVKSSFLSATCDFAPDAGLQALWRALDRVIITQGFIASNAAGETVLLGRGGSDTSGAYIAAKLQAARLEIWTDVPGMFSANPRAVPTAGCCARCTTMRRRKSPATARRSCTRAAFCRCASTKFPCMCMPPRRRVWKAPSFPRNVADSAAQLKAIAIKKGITLVSMESPGMWHQVGFLADAFQIFKREGLSVDLVSTSETNVTVSLDPTANTLDAAALERLTAALGELCRVEIFGPCASLSLLGHNIRAILHELGSAFELFQDQKIYLVTQAANDLNFTFVIDESQGDRLVQQLHERLIQGIGSDRVLGPTWQQLFSQEKPAVQGANWWEEPGKRRRLIDIAVRESAAFVYDAATLDAAVAAVQRREVGEALGLCDEGQLASADRAAAVRGGTDARVRVARRARTRLCLRAGSRSRTRAVHAEFCAAQPNMNWVSPRAFGSLWTIYIRSRCGRRCFAAGRFSCASIRDSDAAITSTCAPAACIRSSACPWARRTNCSP